MLTDFTSSTIKGVEYDGKNLTIEFHNSKYKYTYVNVPKEIYDGLLSAPSKGKYFYKHIKPHFMFTKH